MKFSKLSPDTNMNSLNDILQRAIKSEKTISFIDDRGTTRYSYRDFFGIALEVSATLKQFGYSRGSAVILQTRDNFSLLVYFWACVFQGLIPVPVTFGDSPIRRRKVEAICRLFQDPIILSNIPRAFGMQKWVQISIPEVPNSLPTEPLTGCFTDERDPLFYQFSSGSTSASKGVHISPAMVVENCIAASRVYNSSNKDVFITWMPLTHDFGIIQGHFTPLIVDACQNILNTLSFLRKPSIWLREVEAKQCTVLTTTNFANEYLVKQLPHEECYDLSSVRIIINGAEPIVKEVSDRFISAMKRHRVSDSAFTNAYGLAEATLMVTLQDNWCVGPDYVMIDPMHLGLEKPICEDKHGGVAIANVGKPLPGVAIQIRSVKSTPLPERTVGNIWVKGKSVTSNLLVNNAGSVALKGPWLNTGDVGFIYDGCLYVVGREKDHFKVNGLSYFSNEIESKIQEDLSLDTGSIVIVKAEQGADEIYRGKIICFIKSASQNAYSRVVPAIRSHIQKTFGISVDLFVRVGKIPRTTSGKTRRFLLLSCFLIGSNECTTYTDFVWHSNYNMQTQSQDLVDSLLKAAFSEMKMQYPRDHGELYFSDFEMTSLNLVELVAFLNQNLGLDLNITDIYAFPCLSDFKEHVANLLYDSVISRTGT